MLKVCVSVCKTLFIKIIDNKNFKQTFILYLFFSIANSSPSYLQMNFENSWKEIIEIHI